MKKLTFAFAIACVCLLSVSAFASDVVIVKTTNIAVPNSVAATLLAVNGAGTMVGWTLDTRGVYHCLIVAGGKTQILDHPATTDTRCTGINSRGDLVGSYLYLPTNKVRGFLYPFAPGETPNYFKDIAPPGALYSNANAINDHGNIVGDFTTTDGKTHGFRWNGSAYRMLDRPSAQGTKAVGINNSGMITVHWWAPPSVANGGMHSAMFDGVTYHVMDMPEAKATYAQHISDTGDVVLYWVDAHSITHGAIMHQKQFFKFDFPHAVNTYGMGINNAGIIVGGYTSSLPTPRAFAGFYVIQAEY